MRDEPDMRFDIDALFEHMINNLDHHLDDVRDWSFCLRSPSIELLERIADELGDEFAVELQEEVEEIDADGTATMGLPLLSVVRRAALTPEEVKALAARFSAMASERGVLYEGVACFEPIDEDELFGWLTLDEAIWRLRQFADCGLEDDADLPWTFLVVATGQGQTESVVAELEKSGFDEILVDEEPDEEDTYSIGVFVQGRNNEVELADMCGRIESIAERHGAQLGGIQFYERDDMEEIDADDDAE